jgi:hypothetical protein
MTAFLPQYRRDNARIELGPAVEGIDPVDFLLDIRKLGIAQPGHAGVFRSASARPRKRSRNSFSLRGRSCNPVPPDPFALGSTRSSHTRCRGTVGRGTVHLSGGCGRDDSDPVEAPPPIRRAGFRSVRRNSGRRPSRGIPPSTSNPVCPPNKGTAAQAPLGGAAPIKPHRPGQARGKRIRFPYQTASIKSKQAIPLSGLSGQNGTTILFDNFLPKTSPRASPEFPGSISNSHSPLRFIQSPRSKSGRGCSGCGTSFPLARFLYFDLELYGKK